MRIAIVNDMMMAAEALRRVINGMPGNGLAWIARDGAEAVERCKWDLPDLILMDLIMPVMDGAEATRQIMAHTPCAILVVTATVDGHSGKVFEALGGGALDAVQTPLLSGNGQLDGAASLKFKIDMIGRRGADDHQHRRPGNQPANELQPRIPAREGLVAIGASAGGPAALAAVLSTLPGDFSLAIVIVQHIDAQFVPSMVAWLNGQSRVPVRIAHQGDHPEPGVAMIAATNDHLVFVGSSALGYTPEPRNCSYRPSVDVFFGSVVRYWKGEVAGVLLSGMGRDGAQGLKDMRDAGALTIAQDSASCAVYGMPKAAAELNAAVKILPVNEISKELINFLPSIRRPKLQGKQHV